MSTCNSFTIFQIVGEKQFLKLSVVITFPAGGNVFVSFDADSSGILRIPLKYIQNSHWSSFWSTEKNSWCKILVTRAFEMSKVLAISRTSIFYHTWPDYGIYCNFFQYGLSRDPEWSASFTLICQLRKCLISLVSVLVEGAESVFSLPRQSASHESKIYWERKLFIIHFLKLTRVAQFKKHAYQNMIQQYCWTITDMHCSECTGLPNQPRSLVWTIWNLWSDECNNVYSCKTNYHLNTCFKQDNTELMI